MRSGVLKAVHIKMMVFLDVTFDLAVIYQKHKVLHVAPNQLYKEEGQIKCF